MCKIAKSFFLERICTAWEVTQESIFSTLALLWWFLLLPWFQLFFLWLPNLLVQPWTFVQVLDSHLQLPLNIFTWTAHEDLKISIYPKRAYNSFATNLPTSLVLCFSSFSLSDIFPLWQGKHLESAFFPSVPSFTLFSQSPSPFSMPIHCPLLRSSLFHFYWITSSSQYISPDQCNELLKVFLLPALLTQLPLD